LGEVLHISQACLNAPKGSGNTYVKIKDGQSTFAVCCLQKDTQEHASLDLFVQAESSPSFVAEGPNEVHLLGYWEPNPSLSDEEDDDEGMSGLMGDEGVSESDEENEEEMERFAKKLPNIEELGDEESDEEDDEEDLEEPVEVAKPKALPVGGASANKQKPGQKGGDKPQQQNKNQVPPPKAKAGPKASPKANEVQQGQKRKATDGPAAEPAAKQAKAATPAKVEGGEEKFQADLTEYLTKNGRTSMSELGSKVKKPAGVAKKIGVFLKERKDVFKIEGNNVELLK
jgi:nucleophosmin 1